MIHNVQSDGKRPGGVSNERANETDVLHRDTESGGSLDPPEESKVVESVRDRRNVVEGAECDGIGHRGDGLDNNVELEGQMATKR